MRRFGVILVGGLLALALMGCNQGEPAQEGRQEPPGTRTEADHQSATAHGSISARGGQTTEEATGEVMVGGFSVEGLGGAETTVPQVSVEREAVRQYLNQVQPIVEDSSRSVSGLVEPEVRMENGRLEVELGLGSLREARQDAQAGLERLREVRAPEDLEPIHERLVSAYEEASPAYDNVVEAAESGDPDRLSSAVRENLPRMERFNFEVSAIIQDLRRAVGTR